MLEISRAPWAWAASAASAMASMRFILPSKNQGPGVWPQACGWLQLRCQARFTASSASAQVGRKMRDLHGVQQGRREPAHGHLAHHGLARASAVAYYHEQWDAVEDIKRGKGIDAVAQARVLHEQRGPPPCHPGTGAQAHALLLARDGHVDDIWDLRRLASGVAAG